MPAVTPEDAKTIVDRAVSGTADVTKSAEPFSHLSKKFAARREEFIAAFGTTDFYIQMLFVGIAIAVAWLMARLIQRRVKVHFQKHPLRRLDTDIISKPLALLSPVLAVLYISVVKPFADEFSSGGDMCDVAIQLCIAYFFSKCVVLVIESRLVAYFIASVIMTVTFLRATGFIRYTVAYLDSLGFTIGQFHISMLNLVHGIVILVVVFWIAGMLSRTLESYLRRSSTLSYMARELTVKFFRIFVYFSAFMITLSTLGVDLTAFAVFGGALGVGVGLGLQKITANFVSGITLLMEKSIKIGDLIEVAGNTGWVRQLNIRYALVETAEGKEILIPNEELISTRVVNWTHTTNTARIDITVGVGYESNPARVRELMLSAAKSHPLCLKSPPPNCWMTEFGDYALQFLLIFWIPDVHEGRFGPKSEVMITILEKFRQEGIDIPSVSAVLKPVIRA